MPGMTLRFSFGPGAPWKVIIAVALLLAACLDPSRSFGYQAPEKLEYEISWAGIGVGSASLETARTESGAIISARGATKKWVSLLYPVDDELSSTIQKAAPFSKGKTQRERPLSYRVLLREDKTRVDQEIRFDHRQKKAFFHDLTSGRTVVHTLDTRTTDLLTTLYLLRSMPLEAGKNFSMPVFDNGSAHTLSAQVLRRESINTAMGNVKTLLVRLQYSIAAPGLMYLPGDLFIWLTDDDRRVPVVIEKQIIIPPGSRIPAVLRPKLEAAMGRARMELIRK